MSIENQIEATEDEAGQVSWDELLEEYQDVDSFSPLYTIEFDEDNKPLQKIPVPKVVHYNYRGSDLKDMNRIEYYSLVGIKIMKNNNVKKHHTKGRKQSKIFHFAKSHPLSETHCQYLLSKQTTPIFMGRLPTIPTIPKHTKHFQAKELLAANRFSLFWLTVYRPELTAYNGPKNIKHLDYTWDAFVQWCSQTEKKLICD